MMSVSREKTVLTLAHNSGEAETTVQLNSRHDITVDAYKAFFDRLLSGNVEILPSVQLSAR